jgi:vacuolar-type H+-ATPase subunit E/Vma4
MMSEEAVRQWRNMEQDRVKDIANPVQKKKECGVLWVLNAVLQED